jgi:hypothetical protein
MPVIESDQLVLEAALASQPVPMVPQPAGHERGVLFLATPELESDWLSQNTPKRPVGPVVGPRISLGLAVRVGDARDEARGRSSERRGGQARGKGIRRKSVGWVERAESCPAKCAEAVS